MWWAGRYYRRSIRRGARVVTEYVGAGAVGEVAAAADRVRRDELARARAREGAARTRVREAAADLERLLRGIGLELEGAGYHNPLGRGWRRRRG